MERPCSSCSDKGMVDIEKVLAANREWSEQNIANDADFFSRNATSQSPEWLWIGCSDSRVTANELVRMGPGDLFVHRNVGNLAGHKDINAMTCLEYAVTALKVKHIIVCGHYGCGAVKAALELPCKTPGLVNLWIQDIREVRDNHADLLRTITSPDERWNKLAELNVIEQVFNVCTSPVVQSAWDEGQPLAIHGLVYNLEDGLLKNLTQPLTCLDDFHKMSGSLTAAHSHDHLAFLSKNILTHMSFETTVKEERASMNGNGKKQEPVAA